MTVRAVGAWLHRDTSIELAKLLKTRSAAIRLITAGKNGIPNLLK